MSKKYNDALTVTPYEGISDANRVIFMCFSAIHAMNALSNSVIDPNLRHGVKQSYNQLAKVAAQASTHIARTAVRKDLGGHLDETDDFAEAILQHASQWMRSEDAVHGSGEGIADYIRMYADAAERGNLDKFLAAVKAVYKSHA